MSRPRGRLARSKARQGDSLRHQIPAPCPHSSPPPHGIYIDRCITCGGSPHLSCKRDHIKMRDYVDRRVTPPKRVTSPTWGSSPPCQQALRLLLFYSPFSHRLHCPTETCFLKRINYHDVVAQPERLILVRWMSLEPDEKRVVNHMCLDWVTMRPATATLVKILISAYS